MAGKRGNGDGTISERPSGKYRIQVTVGGRRVTETLPDKTTAKRRLAELTTERERGMLTGPNRVTVEEFAGRWLSRQKDLRPRSLDVYREELAYALPVLGELRVKEVQPHHVKDLMAALADRVMTAGRGKGKTMSPRTQGKVLTRLRAVFREAVSDRIIHANPAEGARKVKAPSPEAVGRVLDFHEVARLAELGWALHEAGLCRLWPALFAAVGVGLRRGEVMGLRWADVDLEKGVLRVRQALTAPRGGARLSGTKTHSSRREVHLPPSLKVALSAHRGARDRERATAGDAWADTGAVFATSLGTYTHPDNLNRALRCLLGWSDPEAFAKKRRALGDTVAPDALARLEAAVMAGEALPRVCVHDLRHTYATLALRRGVPVEVVSKTLGHARVSLTMDVYRHVLESERRATVIDLFDAPVPEREARARAVA